jgi:hypothetical protein
MFDYLYEKRLSQNPNLIKIIKPNVLKKTSSMMSDESDDYLKNRKR